MRYKNSWSTKFRIFVHGSIFMCVATWYSPKFEQWYKYYVHEMHWTDLTIDEWKAQEKHRWKLYLKIWDPYHTGNLLKQNQGLLSNTRFDKFIFGKYRAEEPVPYEKVADEVIRYSELTGIDPAKPLYETIKKMVKYYYPNDLDESPEDTKRVLKPKIQWVYSSNFDEYIDEEESKPSPGSYGRMLWNIPGFQEFYIKLKEEHEKKEEELLRNSTPEERVEYYSQQEITINRLAMEVNDYAPLLAYRWDRKAVFAQYIMDPKNLDNIKDILSRPGGVKQLFINCGIITPREGHDIEMQKVYQFHEG